MKYVVEAACISHTGKVRRNNEDNFFFNRRCLKLKHDSLVYPITAEDTLNKNMFYAVFDGMGGEYFGEYASYAAAHQLQLMENSLFDQLIPPEKYLNRTVLQLNDAVRNVQREQKTAYMGTTMAALYFTGRYVYSCNIGDSRIYRLRDGELLQLSTDHVENRPGKRKAPLIQYLGMDTDEMMMEPTIVKDMLRRGDVYLVCSDGLTDMLTNPEITDILLESKEPKSCVLKLRNSALDHGGRDNITVMVFAIR